MAQVGRISGPLLEENLLRQGIANGTQANLSFKNTNSDTTLLKVDVANGRIGVDLEAVANELQVSQTIQTTDLYQLQVMQVLLTLQLSATILMLLITKQFI